MIVKYLIMYLLLFSCSMRILGQKVQVLDSITKEPLPYAQIHSLSEKLLADSLGYFEAETIEDSVITIKSLGYTSKVLHYNIDQRYILLVPKIKELNMANVKSSNPDLNFLKPVNEFRAYPWTNLRDDSPILLNIIPDKSLVNKKILNFRFRIQDIQAGNWMSRLNVSFPDQIQLRLKIYDENLNEIYRTSILEFTKNQYNDIQFDFDQDPIILGREGIYIKIELIQTYPKVPQVFVQNTSKKSKNYVANTYVQKKNSNTKSSLKIPERTFAPFENKYRSINFAMDLE